MDTLKNYKTTLAGVGAILVAAGHLLTSLSHGDFGAIAMDGPVIITGIGLLLAKDANAEPKK